MLFLSAMCVLYLSLTLSQNIVSDPSVPKIGRDVILSCGVNRSLANSSNWTRRSSNEPYAPFDNDTRYMFSQSTGSTTFFNNFTVRFEYDIASTYRCEALNANGASVGETTHLLTSGINFTPEEVLAYDGETFFDAKCEFQSSPTTLNFSVEWCFQPYRFPSVDTSICIPLLNNSVNSTLSYEGSSRSPTTKYSFTYRVEGVRYEDAGVYRCNVSSGIISKTADIRVRVRDPLEILWPAVGIMIQLVVIAICILGHFLWDTYKEKKNERLRQEKEKQNILTSPHAEAMTDHDNLPNEGLIKVVPP